MLVLDCSSKSLTIAKKLLGQGGGSPHLGRSPISERKDAKHRD